MRLRPRVLQMALTNPKHVLITIQLIREVILLHALARGDAINCDQTGAHAG